jgi:hypothetical protein
VGNGARMRENKIGGAKEHQRVTAELWLHWIGVRGWCGRRSTVVRRRGGGPVGAVVGAREIERKCVCAMQE